VIEEFTVSTRSTPIGVVLEFGGALDVTGAPEALQAITALRLARGQRLVVDLSALAFCDSSGISALLAARNTALAARATMVLVAVPPTLTRTFTRIGLDTTFETYPTLADASPDDFPA
jgi:anti-anti-sigma factor